MYGAYRKFFSNKCIIKLTTNTHTYITVQNTTAKHKDYWHDYDGRMAIYIYEQKSCYISSIKYMAMCVAIISNIYKSAW